MNLTPDQIAENWSKSAPKYDSVFASYTKLFSQEAIKLLNITPEDKVLDVAAGSGSFSLLAAKNGAQVLATDFAKGMLKQLESNAQKQNLNLIKTAVMDGQNLDIPDGTFNVSCSALGLIFFPNIAKGFQELFRVLKSGGRCGVICWGDPQNFTLMKYLGGALKTSIPGFETPSEPPIWARLSVPGALNNGFKQAGFKEIECHSITKDWEFEIKDDMWTIFTETSPPLTALFNQIGPELTSKVGDSFMNQLREDFGTHAKMPAEAYIGIGVK